MILSDGMILLFACIALIAPVVFLIFLNRIPRRWRLAIYLPCAGLHLVVAYFFYALSGLGRTIASGARAHHFFGNLQRQLAAGTVHRECLELPGYAPGVLLTLLAVAAILAGAVFAWRKIRWYSWFVLIFAFIMAHFAFSVCIRAKDRASLETHNAMRRMIYGLIDEKRREGVTDRQMADSIAENLKEFRYSYETLRVEIESEKRIEDALKNLRRAGM